MKVIKYLKNHSLDELSAEFGIITKRYEDRVILNYNDVPLYNDSTLDQRGIQEKKSHPINVECRGLVLSLPDYKILSRGFDRFFNYGEMELQLAIMNFNIRNSEVYSKEDGSYISVYHDGQEWCISTRGTAHAESAVPGDPNQSFADLFKETLKNLGGSFEDLCAILYVGYTYIFELCTRKNRVVTRYENDSIFFLAARHSIYDSWIPPCGTQSLDFSRFGILTPRIFNFKSVEDIQESMHSLPTLDEGYVVWDRMSNVRVKIKNPSYLAIHHLRVNGSLTFKTIIAMIKANDVDEYLTYYPEDGVIFDGVKARIHDKAVEILEVYEVIKGIEQQKLFAAQALQHPFSGILFNLHKIRHNEDRGNVYDMLLNLHVDKLSELLGEVLE